MSTVPNPVFNFSLTDICQQKAKKRLFNIPLSRINNISNSPYSNGYTKEQLDMRRKAEVLKYNNNSTSTKTNNFTKAEKWSQLIKGNPVNQIARILSTNITIIDYQDNYNTITIKYPDLLKTIPTTKYLIDNNNNTIININAYQISGTNGYFYINIIPNGAFNDCIKNSSLLTPTSSSDVPGPIINLFYDPTIPLYNYIKNVDSFSYDSSVSDKNSWLSSSMENIILLNDNSTKVLSLFITDIINKGSYNFSLNIPISVCVNGTDINSNYIDNPIKIRQLDINMDNFCFDVKYNNTSVPFTSQPTMTFYSSNEIQLRYTYNMDTKIGIYSSDTLKAFNPLQFDISFSNVKMIKQSQYEYVAQRYLGYINISNINLNTAPGYIYDFYLQANSSKLNFANESSKKYYYNNIQNTNGPFMIANVSNTHDIANNTLFNPLIPFPPIINGLTLVGI